MEQVWHDLLFAHWPMAEEALRRLVPLELSLDVFNGWCWIAIAPFHMSGIRARGVPAVPGLSCFPELNLRTYVSIDGKPGVFFFSLDAASAIAVWAARTFYRLPYFHATISTKAEGGHIDYASNRSRGHAEFRATYRPNGPVELRPRGTLEHWLTERYCLYTVEDHRIYRAEIHHLPWRLQNAAAEFETNTLASAAGVSLPQVPPLLHFSKRLDVLIWPLHRVR